MTEAGARSAVNTSALIVAGLYFYRRLIEPVAGSVGLAAQPKSIPGAAGQVIGLGPLAPAGRFIVGFGVVFLVLSAVEGGAPTLAGGMALLVALSAILGNGQAVARDVHLQLTHTGKGAPDNTPTVLVGESNFPQRKVQGA